MHCMNKTKSLSGVVAGLRFSMARFSEFHLSSTLRLSPWSILSCFAKADALHPFYIPIWIAPSGPLVHLTACSADGPPITKGLHHETGTSCFCLHVRAQRSGVRRRRIELYPHLDGQWRGRPVPRKCR